MDVLLEENINRFLQELFWVEKCFHYDHNRCDDVIWTKNGMQAEY